MVYKSLNQFIRNRKNPTLSSWIFFGKKVADSNFIFNFELQSTFIMSQDNPLDSINEIKTMMQRSSKFTSISGWSGVWVGIVGMISAWIAYLFILTEFVNYRGKEEIYSTNETDVKLIILGLATLILCVISQNRNQLYREVLYLANHDSLTETLNRRSFTQLSEKALKHKNNHSLSLIMLDIDDFKKLND